MCLGDVFFHGLNIVTQKNATNFEYKSSLRNLRKEKNSFVTQLSEVQKKLEDEKKARKENVGKLQSFLDKLFIEAKKTNEALQGENSKLQSKITDLETGIKKRESDAYNFDFPAYLRNFLAADPEYDWAPHFPPTTPDYIVQFKQENATLIQEAKIALDARIKSELAEMIAEKGANEEEAGA